MNSLQANLAAMCLVAVCCLAGADDIRSFADKADLAPATLKSGLEFLTPETRAMQLDDFENPGFLWVEAGKALFEEEEASPSCQSCHAASGDRALRGVAARYPAVDSQAGELLNLEQRINRCRETHQAQPSLAYESAPLLSLTAYVASLSRGMPYQPSIDGPARSYFERGRAYFFARRGQLNLACTQCHDDNWGRMLRGDRISQGHGNAYPAYRLEWQTLGSLHRRFRDCDRGVRAQPNAAGAGIYVALELYLAWRAGNLALESPGIRR